MQSNDYEEQNITDDERAVALIRHAMNGKALRPPLMPNRSMVSFRLSEAAKEGLRRVAAELGYTYAGHGNISMLLEAIGTDTVRVTPTLP